MWTSLLLLCVALPIFLAAPIRSGVDLEKRFSALPDPKYTPGTALARAAYILLMTFVRQTLHTARSIL